MSFFIPLPRNSTKAYREFIAAIAAEFIVETPYARLRVNEVASLWAAFIEARTAHADLADKPSTSEHHTNRVRAHRRVAALAGRVYHNALRTLTSELPRRRVSVPLETGAALVVKRNGGGSPGPNMRAHNVTARMEREARAAAREVAQ